MSVPGAAVDRWIGAAIVHVPLVLVHGYSPEGRDDPARAPGRRAAGSRRLRRGGAHDSRPRTRGRLRPDDVAPVVATLAARAAPTVMISVSVGAGPALLAASPAGGPRPRPRGPEPRRLRVGGRAPALLPHRRLPLGLDPAGTSTTTPRSFASSSRPTPICSTLPPARSSPTRSERPRSSTTLRPGWRRCWTSCRPERVARQIRARLVLVHGTHDPAVPYTESLRLAAARPNGPPSVLVGVLAHVEASRARRGCRACGRWVPCSWRCTACPRPS